MDFTTNYMGLTLKSPFVPSSGPYSEKVENLKHMEDNGAAAVVLHSIFEEQIRHEELELVHHLEKGNESFAESLSYFPELGHYKLVPEESLTHISRCKKELGIPVIASLNGLTTGGWTSYAAKIEQAGADALECNIYFLATDPEESGAAVEQRYLEIARAVKEQVKIPVAIKLSPHLRTSRASWSPPAPRGSSSSTASTSRTSTSRSSTSSPSCGSPTRPSCCSGSAGSRSSPAA